MNKTRPLIHTLASITVLLSLDLRLSAKEEHPAMHDASEALHAAQTSADPIAKLEEAARHLRQGRANKAGNRVAALAHTEKAIASLKAGRRVEADKEIKEALSLIEKGVALHPRDNSPKPGK